MLLPTRRITALVFVAALLSVAAAPQQQSSFRSSVELLAIDVTVVDAKGAAIRDLRPENFIVEVAGQRRKVVRSDFIDFSDREAAAAARIERTDIVSNQAVAGVPDPRLILLLVDDESFTFAEGTRVFLQLADVVQRAFPGDALAFAPLSGQTAKVEFTTDHTAIVDALRNLQGLNAYAGTGTELGIDETLEIHRDDSFALERALEGAITADLHARTQRTLRALARHLEGLGRLPGVKYLLLVSQGIYIDDDIGVGEELARVAAAASVTLQVLHIDRQDPGGVTRQRPSLKASEDSLFRRAGLETVAAAAGGNMEHAITEPTGAFDRIRRQISTVYRLGVESIREDATAGTRPITVSTTRPGLTVHTHRQVVIPDRTATVDPRARLERALASPLLDRGIPMRMSVFGYRSASGEENIVMSAEADAAPTDLRFAYAVRNHTGVAIVASEVAPEAVTATDGMPPFAVFRTTAPPGEYTVKLAAIDAEGRVGSVSQSVSLPRADTPGFVLGDVVVLPEGADVLHSRPSARISGKSSDASVYFELYSGGPTPATTAAVVMEIADAQSGVSQKRKREEVSLTRAAGYSAAAARVRFSPAMLLPGEYVARVSVEGTNISAMRRFTVE